MLTFIDNKRYAPPSGGATKLNPVVTPNWWKSSTDVRVLIIIDRTHSCDYTNEQLLSHGLGKPSDRKYRPNPVYHAINGLCEYAVAATGKINEPIAFGCALWDAQAWPELLEVMRPTHVFLASLKAGVTLFELPRINPFFAKTIGNPFEHTDSIVYCGSLPLDQLVLRKSEVVYDTDNPGASDAGEQADLLFFCARHLRNLLLGANPYSLAHLKPRVLMVDTMDKFHKMMGRIYDLEPGTIVGVDTETSNLSSNHNLILTLQFAIKEDRGYFIPIEHKDSPFTKGQQRIIKSELRAFFTRDPAGSAHQQDRRAPKLLLSYLNGKFDMRVARACLDFRSMGHHVWECGAGAHVIDENLALLRKYSFDAGVGGTIKYKPFTLLGLMHMSGNTWYDTAPFGKEQRSNLSGLNIMTHVGAQEYSAMDAIATLCLCRQQQAEGSSIKLVLHHSDVASNNVLKKAPHGDHYIDHVIHQMGPTEQVLSTMEEHGAFVDLTYLKSLANPKISPLVKVIKEVKAELFAMDSVVAAEKIVNPVKATGLFGKAMTGVSVFSLKPQHLKVLFIDVLGLKALTTTATGKPSIDKNFLAEYKEKVVEASLVAQVVEASKLLNTYCKTWVNDYILGNMDAAVDNFLRSAFSFTGVVSGRLSSWAPNQTNLPSRGKLAKVIKRMFVAPPPSLITAVSAEDAPSGDDASSEGTKNMIVGALLPRHDASAHEIRIWGNIAHDKNIAKLFRMGYELRQQLLKTPTQAVRDDIKQRGDMHIYGYHMMNNKWIDKSSPERDAQKSVVFG